MVAVRPGPRELAKFQAKEARSAGTRPELVILGDSHAAGWPNGLLLGLGVKRLAKLAITSLLTEELLYTVENSSVDYAEARAVIIQVGANNLRNYVHRPTDFSRPAAIAEGIERIVRLLRERAPRAAILVINAIPGRESGVFTEALRMELNSLLQGRAAETGLFVYVETAPMQPTDPDAYEPDQIHLKPAGYARFLKPALMRTLAGVLP